MSIIVDRTHQVRAHHHATISNRFVGYGYLQRRSQDTLTKGLAQPAQVPGYTVAAKTGTATTQGVPADQTEASVAGFIPASNPQFVILVKIDRPQATIYGGTAAAPLWKAIAQQLMWYYHVPPDKQA